MLAQHYTHSRTGGGGPSGSVQGPGLRGRAAPHTAAAPSCLHTSRLHPTSSLSSAPSPLAALGRGARRKGRRRQATSTLGPAPPAALAAGAEGAAQPGGGQGTGLPGGGKGCAAKDGWVRDGDPCVRLQSELSFFVHPGCCWCSLPPCRCSLPGPAARQRGKRAACAPLAWRPLQRPLLRLLRSTRASPPPLPTGSGPLPAPLPPPPFPPHPPPPPPNPAGMGWKNWAAVWATQPGDCSSRHRRLLNHLDRLRSLLDRALARGEGGEGGASSHLRLTLSDSDEDSSPSDDEWRLLSAGSLGGLGGSRRRCGHAPAGLAMPVACSPCP